MSKSIRYVSLFSGIEAASVAWGSLGWSPVAFSEIEPFPCSVLEARFPDVPNLGDITKIDWSDLRGKVDLVVGGSPCQSFSVAGNRTGLKGASGLMFEYIRAVKELEPEWFIWENVPGALNSEDGKAFDQLVQLMDSMGYGIAWRVLDSQFFGVPQRRKRVFMVGCKGDPAKAFDALFEESALEWPKTSDDEKRKELSAHCLNPWETQTSRVYSSDSVSPTICSNPQGGFNNGAIMMPDITAFPWNTSGFATGTGVSNSVFPTLRAAPCTEPAVVYAIDGQIARGARFGQNGKGWNDNGSAYTLNTIDQQAIAFSYHVGSKSRSVGLHAELSPTLTADWHCPAVCKADADGNDTAYIVRRLTPTECERLQGFPDGWTDIEVNGKEASDSVRYKALGNSMAVPVMRWIGKNIQKTL